MESDDDVDVPNADCPQLMMPDLMCVQWAHGLIGRLDDDLG